MAASVLGRLDWDLSTDKEGHRTYTIRFLVKSNDPEDGPYTIAKTAGLPLIGSAWVYGNDNDPWAFCWPDAKFTQVVSREPNVHWYADYNFTTKPLKRCQDESIENPLSEPAKLSGSFVNRTEEATTDRNGLPIQTSSHEQIRGPAVTFDEADQTLNIEQNVIAVGAASLNAYCNAVNDMTLWGVGPRCVKLNNVTWSSKWYGICFPYYGRTLNFTINVDGFDREVVDEGTKILDPDLPGADPTNPAHFVRYKDANGENTRVLLDGMGSPITDKDDVVIIPVEKYPEVNFFELGVPAVLP